MYRSDQGKNQRSRLIYGFGILLAGALLYFALRGLDWAAFMTSLRAANYKFLPLIFIWSSITSWMRAFRWRILLTAETYISTASVFWANMAGYLGNNILPARAGEFVRAVYVGRANQIPIPFALATGLVERFVDLIALVLIGSTCLAASQIISAQLNAALRTTSLIAVVGLGGILFAPNIGIRMVGIISSLPRIKPSAKEQVTKGLSQFFRGMQALHRPARAGTFIVFTALIWMMDGIGTVVLARALHLEITLTQSLLLLAALGLSSAIPSTPGYVGIYQFVAVVVLHLFGISSANAVAFILVLQILGILIVAFWGTLSLWVAPKNLFGDTFSPDNLAN